MVRKDSIATKLSHCAWACLGNCYAFQSLAVGPRVRSTALHVSELQKELDTNNIKPGGKSNDRKISKIPPRYITPDIEVLDASTYELNLLRSWDEDSSVQRGFDWEIEKLRRYFAGLYQLDDGTWAKRPSLFNFLVNKAQFSTATVRFSQKVA